MKGPRTGKRRKGLAEGDELGVEWEKYADGMPHRLKRKRDFPDMNPKSVSAAARNAAKRMDKAVQVFPDKMGKNRTKFLWVQFADYQLSMGEPCRCGGRRLLRLHEYFARCDACNALILLASPDADPFDSDGEDLYKREEGTYGWQGAGSGAPPSPAG